MADGPDPIREANGDPFGAGGGDGAGDRVGNLVGEEAGDRIVVEAAVQSSGSVPDAGIVIQRSVHRVPRGTTVRSLLQRALGAGAPAWLARLAAGEAGLARHGRRAWLDDVLEDGDRVELVLPILADARAMRRERVAAARQARLTRRSDPRR